MITGVILAGGQNRRMGGRVKALLPIDGVPLLRRQLEEISLLCGRILVVTNKPELMEPITSEFHHAEVSCIPDQYPGQGPLSGIHAACQTSVDSQLWVVGCDMPFLSAEAARAMSSLCLETQVDAIVPVIQQKVQPLHGIYQRHIGTIVELCITEKSLKLMGLLERIRWQVAEETFFLERGIGLQFAGNVNTLEDYEKLL
jgi:molybdopterin-guanine dinucleotide biosynthesis protein A